MNDQLSNIRINQTGYSDTLPTHVAVLSGNLMTLSKDGNLQASAQIETPETDESSGDKVTVINLGILSEGEYSVQCGEE